MPDPNPPSLEDIRLAVARRRAEARDDAVKENLALLEQLTRELSGRETSYE